MPLSNAGLDRDLARLHTDFGEPYLVTDDGTPVQGFFIVSTEGGAELDDQADTTRRTLRSPDELALGTRLTDRGTGRAWKVTATGGEDGGYFYTLTNA